MALRAVAAAWRDDKFITSASCHLSRVKCLSIVGEAIIIGIHDGSGDIGVISAALRGRGKRGGGRRLASPSATDLGGGWRRGEK